MKAYVYRDSGAPWNMEDVPDPQPGPREVLIKVEAAGICGTDLHYRHGRTRAYTAPLIPGHEIAGTVAALGDGVQGVAVGDRACVHYVRSCGRCVHCDAGNDNRCRNRRSIGSHVDGGFAQYIAVPDRNAFKLPDSISTEDGAIIGCAVSTAYHALRLARLQPGETVAVFGLGGVGLHAAAWAKALGAGLVIGVDNVDAKLQIAAAHGADVVLHSERDNPAEAIHALTDGYGAEVALECSGHPRCMEAAIQCVHGKSAYESGRVVGVAVLLEPVVLPEPGSFREGAFMRSGDHTRAELRQVIRLVETGRVDLSRSVTHRFAFDELEKAMELIESRKETVIRAVLMVD